MNITTATASIANNAAFNAFFSNVEPNVGLMESILTISRDVGRAPVINTVCNFFILSFASDNASSSFKPIPGPEIKISLAAFPFKSAAMFKESTRFPSR